MHLIFFSDKSLKFFGQLFNVTGNIKPSENIKIEFHLKDTHKIYWLQIIDALQKTYKDIILKDKGNAKYLVIFEHHVSKIMVKRNLLVKNCIIFLMTQMPLNRQH